MSAAEPSSSLYPMGPIRYHLQRSNKRGDKGSNSNYNSTRDDDDSDLVWRAERHWFPLLHFIYFSSHTNVVDSNETDGHQPRLHHENEELATARDREGSTLRLLNNTASTLQASALFVSVNDTSPATDAPLHHSRGGNSAKQRFGTTTEAKATIKGTRVSPATEAEFVSYYCSSRFNSLVDCFAASIFVAAGAVQYLLLDRNSLVPGLGNAAAALLKLVLGCATLWVSRQPGGSGAINNTLHRGRQPLVVVGNGDVGEDSDGEASTMSRRSETTASTTANGTGASAPAAIRVPPTNVVDVAAVASSTENNDIASSDIGATVHWLGSHPLDPRCPYREQARRNAGLHERLIVLNSILNVAFGIFNVVLECRDPSPNPNDTSGDGFYRYASMDYFCSSTMQMQPLFLLAVLTTTNLSPLRAVILVPLYALLLALYYSIRWIPGVPYGTSAVQYWALALVLSLETLGCVAISVVREVRARRRFEHHVDRFLLCVQTERMRRKMEVMADAQVPLVFLRHAIEQQPVAGGRARGLNQHGAIPFTYQEHQGIVIVLGIAGFGPWSSRRGPSDYVEILQQVHNTYDRALQKIVKGFQQQEGGYLPNSNGIQRQRRRSNGSRGNRRSLGVSTSSSNRASGNPLNRSHSLQIYKVHTFGDVFMLVACNTLLSTPPLADAASAEVHSLSKLPPTLGATHSSSNNPLMPPGPQQGDSASSSAALRSPRPQPFVQLRHHAPPSPRGDLSPTQFLGGGTTGADTLPRTQSMLSAGRQDTGSVSSHSRGGNSATGTPLPPGNGVLSTAHAIKRTSTSRVVDSQQRHHFDLQLQLLVHHVAVALDRVSRSLPSAVGQLAWQTNDTKVTRAEDLRPIAVVVEGSVGLTMHMDTKNVIGFGSAVEQSHRILKRAVAASTPLAKQRQEQQQEQHQQEVRRQYEVLKGVLVLRIAMSSTAIAICQNAGWLSSKQSSTSKEKGVAREETTLASSALRNAGGMFGRHLSIVSQHGGPSSGSTRGANGISNSLRGGGSANLLHNPRSRSSSAGASSGNPTGMMIVAPSIGGTSSIATDLGKEDVSTTANIAIGALAASLAPTRHIVATFTTTRMAPSTLDSTHRNSSSTLSTPQFAVVVLRHPEEAMRDRRHPALPTPVTGAGAWEGDEHIQPFLGSHLSGGARAGVAGGPLSSVAAVGVTDTLLLMPVVGSSPGASHSGPGGPNMMTASGFMSSSWATTQPSSFDQHQQSQQRQQQSPVPGNASRPPQRQLSSSLPVGLLVTNSIMSPPGGLQSGEFGVSPTAPSTTAGTALMTLDCPPTALAAGSEDPPPPPPPQQRLSFWLPPPMLSVQRPHDPDEATLHCDDADTPAPPHEPCLADRLEEAAYNDGGAILRASRRLELHWSLCDLSYRFNDPATESTYWEATTSWDSVTVDMTFSLAACSLTFIGIIGACIIDGTAHSVFDRQPTAGDDVTLGGSKEETYILRQPIFWALIGVGLCWGCIALTMTAFPEHRRVFLRQFVGKISVSSTTGKEKMPRLPITAPSSFPRVLNFICSMIAQLVFFFALAFSTGNTSFVYHSQTIWIIIAFVWAAHRPLHPSVLMMTLRDVVNCTAILVRTVYLTEEASAIATYFVAASFPVIILLRVFRERRRRVGFVLDMLFAFHQEELEHDYTSLEKVLTEMVPLGVAGKLVQRVRGDQGRWRQSGGLPLDNDFDAMKSTYDSSSDFSSSNNSSTDAMPSVNPLGVTHPRAAEVPEMPNGRRRTSRHNEAKSKRRVRQRRKVHPMWSASGNLEMDEVPFLLLQLSIDRDACQQELRHSQKHATQVRALQTPSQRQGSASSGFVDDRDEAANTDANDQTESSGTESTDEFSHDDGAAPSSNSLLHKQLDRLALLSTLHSAIPEAFVRDSKRTVQLVQCSHDTAMLVALPQGAGADDQDELRAFDLLTTAHAIIQHLQKHFTEGGEDTEHGGAIQSVDVASQPSPLPCRMLLDVGAAMGAVLGGTSSVSFGYHGGVVHQAVEALSEMPWGSNAGSQRFVELVQQHRTFRDASRASWNRNPRQEVPFPGAIFPKAYRTPPPPLSAMDNTTRVPDGLDERILGVRLPENVGSVVRNVMTMGARSILNNEASNPQQEIDQHNGANVCRSHFSSTSLNRREARINPCGYNLPKRYEWLQF